MEMKEVHANPAYKVLEVTLDSGEKMPQHYASSDAFLIVTKGKAKVQLPDREEVLEPGTRLHISASLPHTLQVEEGVKAFVVLAADAQIEFTDF